MTDNEVARRDEVLAALTRILRREATESAIVTTRERVPTLCADGKVRYSERTDTRVVEIPPKISDVNRAADLLETLVHHKDGCVGMAANMIGVSKRIIAFDNEGQYMVMFNPVILKKSGPYETEEGCLSLTGVRPAKRWKTIKVQWQNEKFQQRIKNFTGWTAQIIQHEIDHCEGIII